MIKRPGGKGRWPPTCCIRGTADVALLVSGTALASGEELISGTVSLPCRMVSSVGEEEELKTAGEEGARGTETAVGVPVPLSCLST